MALTRALALTRQEQFLRNAALVFAVALAVHGADHARRGMDVVSTEIAWAGNIQAGLAVLTVLLVLTRTRGAALAAVITGFASALGFTVAHLLPTWGVFSDSFLTPAAGSGVTVFSWLTAVIEIGADLLLGWAGVRALRRTPAAAA
ncbi:MAG: hypothetical protein ACRDTU_17060 [Micromonosporaceae bacterium]